MTRLWQKEKSIVITLFFFLLLFSSNVDGINSDEWSMYGHDNIHSGYYPIKGKFTGSSYKVNNFTLSEGNWVYPQPTTGDIRGDNGKEIIIASDPGNVHCISPSGVLLWTTRLSGRITASITLDDVDDDNEIELLVGCEDGSLYVINPDGKIDWIFNTNTHLDHPGAIKTSPMVADIDNDGTKEIIITTSSGEIVCINSNRELEWNLSIQEQELQGGFASTPTLADLNNDGDLEIILGSVYKYLYAVQVQFNEDTKNYEPNVLWKFQTSSTMFSVMASPIVSDIDMDDIPEILFGSEDNYFYCLDNTGKLIWKYRTGKPIYTSCSITDLDHDGFPDIVFGSYDKNIYILNYEGRLVNKIPTYEVVTMQIILNDINSDDEIELIVGTPMEEDNPSVSILNYYGDILGQIPYRPMGNLSGISIMNLIVCDLDDDQYNEIIFGTADGTLVIVSDKKYVISQGEDPPCILMLIILIVFCVIGLIYYIKRKSNR